MTTTAAQYATSETATWTVVQTDGAGVRTVIASEISEDTARNLTAIYTHHRSADGSTFEAVNTEIPAIPTTRANVPDAAEADAFYAMIQTRAAARKAEVTPARTPRQTKAEKQLALMMDQYERDVAANPNTTIWNPQTGNFDAYRDGAIVAQDESYLAAEAARLAHLTRDAAGVVAVDEAPTDPRCENCRGDGYIDPVTRRGFEVCPVCGGSGFAGGAPLPPVGDDGNDQIPPPPALSDDEAADVDALAAYVRDPLLLPDEDDYCWLCGVFGPCPHSVPPAVPVGQVVSVPGGDTWAVSELAPKPLPTCRECGRTCAVHGDDWCGCIPAVAMTCETEGCDEPGTIPCICGRGGYVCVECSAECRAPTQEVTDDDWQPGCPNYARGVLCPEETRDCCDECADGELPLPFELTAEDRAHDRAVLEDIERMAGAVDDELVRRLAA